MIAGTILCLLAIPAQACRPTDYLAVDLPPGSEDPIRDALLLAYPDLQITPDGASWSSDGVMWHSMGQMDSGDPKITLEQADLRDQFRYLYPLEFDLERRKQPFEDPGRPRNDKFFRALYGNDADSVRQSLVMVGNLGPGSGYFTVTTRRGVDCQLAAALALIAASGEEHTSVFRDAGGGFNWRVIAGTDRLSAHSFGVAVDLNPEIGQYWRWTGAAEGAVGTYQNRVPEQIVRAMERYGFIWGGKWHHYDGMHFEYRPELILYSRLID